MNFPFVSLILPIRNEANYIAACLEAIFEQDYPPQQVEILVVDGFSTDNTRAIVQQMALQNGRIRLLDNPQKIVSSAMNIGIRQAKGDIIIRIDARCLIEPDYVRQCVTYLQQTGAHNVGGAQRPIGETFIAKAIALASGSPFGAGTAQFRHATRPQYVDTVYLGAFPKTALLEVGLYDESLLRNQDYELNYRLRQAGGKIFFTPAIKSVYYGRPTLRGLWKQYYQYGLWKVRMLQKHPRSLRLRQLAAPIFVASLFLSLLLSPLWLGRRLLKIIGLGYGAMNALFTLKVTVGSQANWRYGPLIPVIFVILHVSWGLGFLAGLGKWGVASRLWRQYHRTFDAEGQVDYRNER